MLVHHPQTPQPQQHRIDMKNFSLALPRMRHACIVFIALLCLGLAWLPPAEAQRTAHGRAAGPTVLPVSSAGIAPLLDSLRGHVVVLNVWATWCVPCVEEFPDLLKLAAAHADRGVRLVLISADMARDVDRKVRPFLKRHKVEFTTWIKRSGGDQEFIDAVHPDWGGPIPVTVIYDREGRRRALLEGKQSYEEFEAALLPLL